MRARGRVGRSVRAMRVAVGNRRLRLVQLARLASVTGRWAYTVTFAVFAYRSGGAAGVALAGIVRLAPAAVAAPLAGSLIGRTRVDVLLARGGLVRTLALAGAGTIVLLGAPSASVYALVVVESAVSTLMRPAQNSLLPALARSPAELTATNLALSVIESAGVFLGPLIGAVLLRTTGIGVVFLASAGAYLASTILLLPIRLGAGSSEADRPRTHFLADAVAGARAVTQNRDAATIVFLYGAQNLVAGALNVLIVVLALRLLGLGQSGVGVMTAAVGIGGVVGGGLVFARLRTGRHGIDLGLGLLLWGVPLLLLAILSSRAGAFALLAVVGVGATVVDVSTVTLLQRLATGELLSHALGLLQTVLVAAIAVGTLLAPLLVSSIGVRGSLGVMGSLLPLLAAALWRRLRRIDRGAPPTPHFVALLADIPIFEPLADTAVEHLASALTPVALTAGTTVFSQGDHGDGFYVVEEGEVDVVQDGDRIATLDRGGYFGEIALLRDVPRTATVVARTGVRLLRLDRDRFLATVTGNASSARAADSIVAARAGLRAGFASL